MIYLKNTTDPQTLYIPRNNEVGFPSMNQRSYESGYTDGVAYQKSLLSSTGITENGHYTSENGWNEIDVNVQTGSSVSLSSITITANTAITETDKAYTGITVNVPQTGYTQQDLDDAYTSGVTIGENTIIATFSSATATTNGQYGSSANPLSAITVDVPTYNIETNKPFTATSSGNYTIQPSNIWSITFNHKFARRYDFTINGNIPQTEIGEIAYRIVYYDEMTEEEPSVSIIIGSGNTLSLLKNNWDEDDYGDVDFGLFQGKYRLNFDNDNLDSSEFSIIPIRIGEKYDAMSAVSLNVNVDNNIETNKPFIATSNGNYTITPSSGQTTMRRGYEDGVDFYFTASTYPSVGYFEIGTIKFYNSNDNPIGSVDIYYEDGQINYDDSDWDERIYKGVTGNTMLYIGFNEDDYSDYIWREGEDFSINYDAMSAVSLNVNVDTASTYQSGYTSGSTDGENAIIGTFTAMTATTNGEYGSSAHPLSSITVDVAQTGTSIPLSSITFTANTAITVSELAYTGITVDVPNAIGDLDVLYCDNNTLWHFNVNETVYPMYKMWINPTNDLKITVVGKDNDSFTVSSVITLSANTNNISISTGRDSGTVAKTDYPNVYYMYVYQDIFHMGTDSVNYDDVALYNSFETITYIEVSGSNYYFGNQVVDAYSCPGVPYVDDNGVACLRKQSVYTYPTQGNAYAVYKREINGNNIYYVDKPIVSVPLS